MTNYSRTTLRELKKRYLNILKKCLLANLGLILLSTPSIAETEIIFDEVYENMTKTNTDTRGGAVELWGYRDDKIESAETTLFDSNTAIATSNFARGGALWIGPNSSASFSDIVHFKNNTAQGNQTAGGGAIWLDHQALLSVNAPADTTTSGGLLFYNNKATSTVESNGGAIINYGGVVSISVDTIFDSNVAEAMNGNAYGGALFNISSFTFEKGGHATFINNEAIGKNVYGGAIHNGGVNAVLIFNDEALFKNNKATAVGSYSYGGAINNRGGSVVFEDMDNNTEMPAVPNITYSMTFKGDTTFTGNKAESETSISYGGAIYNGGYMLLAGENTFGGYLQDTEDADEDGDKTEYILDSEGNKISLGNQATLGGAIFNTCGKKEGDVIAYGMTFGKSTFMGNTALSHGGLCTLCSRWTVRTDAMT